MKHETVAKVATATQVETYLRRATRGLWGKKRLEVREELAAHLEARVLSYQLAGLGETDAVEKALSELGNPQEVSSGMAKLYTFPKVAGSGLAFAALCAIALWPKGTAQSLPGTFYWPSTECVKALESNPNQPSGNACLSVDNSLWVSQQAMERALEPQGVTFGYVSVPESDEGLLSLTFPSSTPIYVSFGNPGIFFENKTGTEIDVAPGYLSLWNFVKAASYQKDLSIKVDGWDNPTIHFNDVSLQIGTDSRPMLGTEFYENYLNAVFFKDLVSPIEMKQGFFLLNPLVDVGTPLQEAELEIKAVKPGIYGVITIIDPDTLDDFLSRMMGFFEADVYVSFQVIRVEDGNTLSADLPEKPVRFVNAFGADKNINSAVMVRLDGGARTGGWFEVVSPDRITVQ